MSNINLIYLIGLIVNRMCSFFLTLIKKKLFANQVDITYAM